MFPFRVEIKPGAPVYEQVVYAVQKAVLKGQLKPGSRFPSVRQLSQELRINPNTAHKIVAHLTAEGLLAVQPGIGTVVQKAAPRLARATEPRCSRTTSSVSSSRPRDFPSRFRKSPARWNNTGRKYHEQIRHLGRKSRQKLRIASGPAKA